MNEEAVKLFTVGSLINKAELIVKVAIKEGLDSNETQFFINLITLKFPHAVESYMITWAKRIRLYSEYDHADGDLREWMKNNKAFFNMNNERNKERYYHLMTIDNGLHSLDEKEQEEFDGLEKVISWDEEIKEDNKQVAEAKYDRQDSNSGRDSG